MLLMANGTRSRKQKAFDCLYQRYARRMINYFYEMLNRDQAKAQDFLHDLFLKLIENPNQFDPSRKFSAWLYRLALNMCRNEYRRLSVRHAHQEDLKTYMEEAQSEDIKPIDFQANIQRLSEDHRTVIILRHKFRCSIKEIADVCACSEGTVKSRLYYATKKLASFIGECDQARTLN